MKLALCFGEPLVLLWGIANQESDICLQHVMGAGHQSDFLLQMSEKTEASLFWVEKKEEKNSWPVTDS